MEEQADTEQAPLQPGIKGVGASMLQTDDELPPIRHQVKLLAGWHVKHADGPIFMTLEIISNLSAWSHKFPIVRQVTIRAVLIGIALSFVFCIITLKLDLTAGIIPGFGIASCLLGFAGVKVLSNS